MKSVLTRRAFMRSAAIASLGVVAAACSQPQPTTVPPVAEEKEAAPSATTAPATAVPATIAPAADDYLNKDSLLPIAKNPITMSMITTRQANGGRAEGMWYFDFMEQLASIKFDVTRIDSGARTEQINLMFASGQLPDVFLHSGFSTTEIVQYGMLEQQFLPLNDLIDEYAPNIVKTFAQYPEVKAAVTCPDGNIYSLPSVLLEVMAGNRPEQTVQRAFIRHQWIENLGLEDPETLDDLYDVLKAFKEQDPNGNGADDEVPFTGAWNSGFDERCFVATALGFVTSGGLLMAMLEGEPVVFSAHPRYAEYLKYMNRLWNDGLLDRDIFTLDETAVNAKASQGVVGLMAGGAPFVFDPQNYAEWEAFVPVTSEWNSQKLWGTASSVTPGAFLLTNKCPYPEAAIRVADLYFTEKYSFMFWHGPKKDSEEALGHAGWYVQDDKLTYDYPEGITTNWDHANTLNPISGHQVGFSGIDEIRHLREAEGITLPVDNTTGDMQWRLTIRERVAPYVQPNFPGAIYLEPEAQERIRELQVAISDYATPMEARFIVGEEPLTDDNLERYFAQMQNLGVDEYLQIYRDAYETYRQALEG